jgi:hypothetical protein
MRQVSGEPDYLVTKEINQSGEKSQKKKHGQEGCKRPGETYFFKSSYHRMKESSNKESKKKRNEN